MDCLLIRNYIGLGVSGGQGGFVEYIVGVVEFFFFQFVGVGQCFGDGFFGDELFVYQVYCYIYVFVDQWFVVFVDDVVQGVGEVGFVMG